LYNLLFAQHVSGTIMPIIRSSRFIQMVAACGTWRFGLQLQHPANRTHNPQLHTRSTKTPSTTGSNHLYKSWAPDDGHNGARNMLSEPKLCNKNQTVASSWHFISTY